ncbi:MAG: hypothetical protein OXU79_05525, partial [Gemmatimonadota bacterium]|nr:hypothetical protein [Gemmatimonadota bacterium]
KKRLAAQQTKILAYLRTKERSLRETYERAAEALAELYQQVGGLAFDRDSGQADESAELTP